MKAIFVRSIWDGIIILVLLILGSVGYGYLISGGNFSDILALIIPFICIAPLGLPFLLFATIMATDGRIRKLSKDINKVGEAKNRIMMPSWVFALIASFPTLLLIGYLTVYFMRLPNIGAAGDVVVFVTLPFSACSLFLVLISGSIARRSAEKAKSNENST